MTEISDWLRRAASADVLPPELASAGVTLLRNLDADTPFPVPSNAASRKAQARKGVLLDVETTGFSADEDEVIELAIQAFEYDQYGILGLGENYLGRRDPGCPIPEEVVRLTGITDDMVRGQMLDRAAISRVLDGAGMVLAHNAEFDRPFVQKSLPGLGLDRLAWGCSVSEIDWSARGLSTRVLEFLAFKAGYAIRAHSALDDVRATLFILASNRFGDEEPFVELRRSMATKTLHIAAAAAPFEAKDTLKSRGYLWAGEDGRPPFQKVWHKAIPLTEERVSEEVSFLAGIYGRKVVLPCQALTARDRYLPNPNLPVEDFVVTAAR